MIWGRPIAVTPTVIDQSHEFKEPLTTLELEVLCLAANAMSNPEIAAALVIEVSTESLPKQLLEKH